MSRSRIQGWNPSQVEGDIEVVMPLSEPCQVYTFSVNPKSEHPPGQQPPGAVHTILTNELSFSLFHERDTHDPPRKGDPDWVPRPRNCWMIFRCEYVTKHKRGQEKSPTTSSSDPLSIRKAAEAWSCLSAEERKHYELLAEQEKLEHARNNPFYQYRPRKRDESGSSAHTRSDSSRNGSSRVSKRRRAPKEKAAVLGKVTSYTPSLVTGARSSTTPPRHEMCSFTASEGSDGLTTRRGTSVEEPGFEQSSESKYPLVDSFDSPVGLPVSIPNSPVLERAATYPNAFPLDTESYVMNWNFLPTSIHTIPSQSSPSLADHREDRNHSLPPSYHDSESQLLAAVPKSELHDDLYPWQHPANRPPVETWNGASCLEGTFCECSLHNLSYGVARGALMFEDLTFKPSSVEEEGLFEELINFSMFRV